MPFIRSISGLRATLGDGLHPSVLSNYAAAFDKIQPSGKIIIGRDGRPSGSWIEQILCGTLAACGRQVNVLGVVPTPTIQMAVEHGNAAGGISISASHNPEQWNGLKFINHEGVFLDLKENTKLWKAEEFGVFNFNRTTEKADPVFDTEAINFHIKSILKLPAISNSISAIGKKKLKVVVDAVNGAGSEAIPKLLRELGCNVIEINCLGNGMFPHTPEPIPKNLSQLADAVKQNDADFGIAVDPDADRLVLIDEHGNPIGEERTIVLAIESVLSNIKYYHQGKDAPYVVVNLSTTKAVNDLCLKYKAQIERSAVGEINVVKAMKKLNAVIGGEGSGGVILPACHYGRDSLVGSALIISLIANRNTTLSALNDSLPAYKMVKRKCFFNGDLNKLYSDVIDLFPNGRPLKGDGIKISFPDSWVQVRASNTEPIVRIIAEDPDLKEAKNLVNTVLQICETS